MMLYQILEGEGYYQIFLDMANLHHLKDQRCLLGVPIIFAVMAKKKFKNLYIKILTIVPIVVMLYFGGLDMGREKEFSVGDLVEIIKTDSEWLGKTGRVKEILGSEVVVHIYLHDVTFDISELSLVKGIH